MHKAHTLAMEGLLPLPPPLAISGQAWAGSAPGQERRQAQGPGRARP